MREVAAKCKAQREEFDAGEGRAGDNIRAYMASVREHRVTLDPSVMVALMSMLVLEGWQLRLDPGVSIIQGIDRATDGGFFGFASRINSAVQAVRDAVSGVWSQ